MCSNLYQWAWLLKPKPLAAVRQVEKQKFEELLQQERRDKEVGKCHFHHCTCPMKRVWFMLDLGTFPSEASAPFRAQHWQAAPFGDGMARVRPQRLRVLGFVARRRIFRTLHTPWHGTGFVKAVYLIQYPGLRSQKSL